MKNERKTPEIRITGFKDDWEHKRFDRVFDFLQNNTLSRAALNYENGTIKNIHYGCILRSPADSDAFQSGRYAEHNGRPKTRFSGYCFG